MTEELIIAGFGGQGVLSMGQVICYGGIMEGLEVSWMPSYGPEMRGGTANCTAILSQNPISSPVLNKFDTAIVLNQPSMDKFENAVKPGGLLIYERNGMIRKPNRKDITICSIGAYDESLKMNNVKVFNMIVVGGFLKAKPILQLDNVIKGLEKVLPTRYHNLISLNKEAILAGMNIISFEYKP
ncbi:MAG TPA: 2-oxoglutarate ferredoxin oxidoreductase subunit gamma [Bacteroidales bacterium]|nr:2-oxoglutarate ferredoxin oxidoreductase subunit gamma [Bacteroidales bacterium]